MAQRLAGRSALVTGSTSGIGRAIAEAFAAEGAHVVLSGRRAELGAAVVAGIRGRGGSAEFVEADLNEGAAKVTEFAAAVCLAAGGKVDILVNNAAHLVPATATLGSTEATIDRALAVNVKAPLLVTAALVPAMIAQGSGVVINIGSINGTTGMAGAALYGATKAAVHSLTKSWAAEFGRRGIRVNTIAPGPTEAEWNEPFRELMGELVANVPSGRLSRVDEVAAAAVFLASDEASHVHGTTIAVDGGMAATLRSNT